jgi:arylsulfatase A-like enzyme
MNVVVLVVDTLRYDHVAPEGIDAVETPNLDRFADRSIWFSRAFTSSFPPVPVRQEMLRGVGDTPFYDWSPLECDRTTLPDALADAGYVTQLIHDTPHLVNGGHRFDNPFHAWTPIRGAECDRPWIASEPEFPDNWAFDDRFDGYGIERDREAVFEGNKDTIRNYAYAHRNRTEGEDWNVAGLFRTGAEFLEDNADREDFFLWMDCFDPHEPWDAPPEYVEKYDAPGRDGRIDPRSFHSDVYNDDDLAKAGREHKVAQYRAKVTFMDRWFGAFLDALEETGLIENTAVLVCGDHGTSLDDNPNPGRRNFGKSWPPDQSEAHVPMMLHVPGEGSGRCETPVRLTDVFGTVAARAGAGVPADAATNDLLRVANDPDYRPHEVVPTSKHVANWEWKGAEDLIAFAYDEEWGLGLAADPGSCVLRRIGGREDVSGEHPAVVERLRKDAIAELDRLGLDDGIVAWLRSGGEGAFPEEYEGRGGSGPDWFSPYFSRPIPN